MNQVTYRSSNFILSSILVFVCVDGLNVIISYTLHQPVHVLTVFLVTETGTNIRFICKL